MAQFLIKAKEPWNNSDVNAPSNRSRLGDIIVVRPDTHVWGSAECLPDFIVVKITNMSYEDAKHLEEALHETYIDEDGKEQVRILKNRKFQVPLAYMNKAISDGTSFIEMTLNNKQQAFLATIIEKTN